MVRKFRRYPPRLCPNYQNLFVIYPLFGVNNIKCQALRSYAIRICIYAFDYLLTTIYYIPFTFY